MQYLFTPAGEAALSETLLRRPLIAFDFDGTLAPIVARPDDARISEGLSERLRSLAAKLPVAIVTGRAVADVRGRLGFDPRYVVGSHGAEDGLNGDAAAAAAYSKALDPLRDLLRAHRADLDAAGIGVEDKWLSIALHYRLAREAGAARGLIQEILEQPGLAIKVFSGKMVVNVMAPGAPDKAHAVQALVERSGADCALFAGDDINDEPVFVSAPPHWLTVRIGCEDPNSSARFFLDSPIEVAILLERMLILLSRLDNH